MTKAVYMYDDSKTFTGSKLVADDYVATGAETELAPEPGLYEPITLTDTGWVGTAKGVWQAAQQATYDAYIKEHPEEAPQASALETQVAQLAYQQMTATQTITDLQTQNAQIAYQLMTTQGGTAQ